MEAKETLLRLYLWHASSGKIPFLYCFSIPGLLLQMLLYLTRQVASFINPFLCDFSSTCTGRRIKLHVNSALQNYPQQSTKKNKPWKDTTGCLNKLLCMLESCLINVQTTWAWQVLQTMPASGACTNSLCVTLPVIWDQSCTSGWRIILLSQYQSELGYTIKHLFIYLLACLQWCNICFMLMMQTIYKNCTLLVAWFSQF